MDLKTLGKQAKEAALQLSISDTQTRNLLLSRIAQKLQEEKASIFAANTLDITAAKSAGAPSAVLDRLTLSQKSIDDMCTGIEQLLTMPDPLGRELSSHELQPGLIIKKRSVPLGVIGIIYEGRPNVTIDAATLALKSGNAVILRGSATALHSNRKLVQILQEVLKQTDVHPHTVQLIDDPDRSTVLHLLKLRDYIDVILPRGGKDLIDFVVNNSSVPVIETGAGVCHLYIDKDCDLQMAIKVMLNAKTQRPSVCNAIETVLINQDLPKANRQLLLDTLLQANVQCFGCAKTVALDSRVLPATEENWNTEYQDLKASVKHVADVDEAIAHINCYGTKHSEAILTNDKKIADKFKALVDAAVVYHNASTRFTDGFQFGFGAELGISTQKLHARGPMALVEMTSYKYEATGDGHCR